MAKRLTQRTIVGEPLLKHQTMVGGPYRAVYDARRARTAETHPDWSDLQSHLDGMRIMTKKLIFDLWSEWRRPKKDSAFTAHAPRGLRPTPSLHP